MDVLSRPPEERAALLRRIDTLERQAAAIDDAVLDEFKKDEAQMLIEILRRARKALQISPYGAPNVGRAVDAASQLWSSLGR